MCRSQHTCRLTNFFEIIAKRAYTTIRDLRVLTYLGLTVVYYVQFISIIIYYRHAYYVRTLRSLIVVYARLAIIPKNFVNLHVCRDLHNYKIKQKFDPTCLFRHYMITKKVNNYI